MRKWILPIVSVLSLSACGMMGSDRMASSGSMGGSMVGGQDSEVTSMTDLQNIDYGGWPYATLEQQNSHRHWEESTGSSGAGGHSMGSGSSMDSGSSMSSGGSGGSMSSGGSADQSGTIQTPTNRNYGDWPNGSQRQQ